MRPTDRLERAIHELTIATHAWPGFRAAVGDRLHDGYPSTISVGYTTDMADPTGNAVTQRQKLLELWEEANALCVEAHGTAARLATIVTSLRDPDTGGSQRCTGAPTEPWGDATCDRLAVRAGLCWACIKRRQRWNDVHMSTG